jgi:hypothetical protein
MIIILFLATACAPVPGQNAALNTSSPQDKVEEVIQGTAEPSEAAPVPSPVADDGLQKKITGIVTKDLATRLSINPEEINVTTLKAVEWPNSALGCPLPGKVYPQGKVPGFRIQLHANDKEYFYHTDRLGQFVLCAEQDPELENFPGIPVTPGKIQDGQPWQPAD